MKRIKTGLVALVAAALALSSAGLKAEGEGLTGSVGLAVSARPEFEGSDRYKALVLPMADLRYGPVFLSMTQILGLNSPGLGVNLVSAPGWTAAPAVRYRWARKEKDSALLRGLGDIDDGIEAGGVIQWQPGPAGLSLRVFQGLGRLEGLTAELEANYGAVLAGGLKGSVRLSAMFADSKYNRCYFGITPAQSDRSAALGHRYSAYDPGAGLKHAALYGALGYDLTESLELGFSAEYKRLAGPAADSPLVKRGSANQFMSSVSLSFNF